MAVSAMLSLSYPPPTERMMCAGTMAMIMHAAAPAVAEPEHSPVSRPRRMEAETPNHAGTKQHTSLRVIAHLPPSALSAFQMATEVICMPG